MRNKRFGRIMNWVGVLILLGSGLAVQARAGETLSGKTAENPDGIYGFSMVTIDGQNRSLAAYQGTVLLVVNTASKCGYTPQYASLEALYRRFKKQGFTILAFPANNFGHQEPGTNAQIRSFCQANYDVSFDLFSKISVRGDDIHPLYRFLTSRPNVAGDIRWNFTKFLVGRDGRIVARFEPATDPLSPEVVAVLEKELARH